MTRAVHAIRPGAILLFGVIVTACSFAPEYKVPETPATSAYKEDVGNWTAAQPGDVGTRGDWWKTFGDPILDDLEARAFAANQNLIAAEARYRQARAASDIAGTNLFPLINLTGAGTRERISANTPGSTGGANGGGTTTGAGNAGSSANRTSNAGRVLSDYVLRAQTSYEIDLWGRVRNTVAAARSRTQASAADLSGAQLSIETELAGNYFELRGMDAQIDLLNQSLAAYREALRITRNRHEGGVSPVVDVDQAQTQVETTEVQLANAQLSRAQLEHAIAILVGATPSGFALAPAALNLIPPEVTPGLPSQLLQRRADVAGAERNVFAANAEIGVTKAAWFPVFSLNAAFGFEGSAVSNFIEAPARMWSIGPSVALAIFDAGLRHAQNQQAVAAFDESVANYRQSVLAAYGEVEDQLSAIRWLDVQTDAQGRAVGSSQRSLDQANYRYKGGIVTFLEVVSTQNAALQAQQAALNLRVRRLNASLQLIKALGGGWTPDQLDQPLSTAARTSLQPGAN